MERMGRWNPVFRSISTLSLVKKTPHRIWSSACTRFRTMANQLSQSRAETFFRGWNSIGVASNSQPNAGEAKGVF